jgi:hypothetical protein
MTSSRLPIALDRPCDADWRDMTPRERGRHCGACDRTVHDLSAMSEDEARDLLDANDGSLCIRYVHDASGRVLHRGDALGSRTLITMRERMRGRWLAVAGVAMVSVLLEACGGARGRWEDRIHAAPEPEDPERDMDAGTERTRGGEAP